ncbi:ABC transporter ATP-binding protein [Oceanicella actignis]|uniref:ABC transporter ATP-binding protein n=1 Tax=Oceanicella actignis TaxID=1189325 RepID=UPI0011E75572|nr:ABC transporter ATP-binding protein [Oceanicella actignis]TYO89183.1 branched-chain amino acid transport system ATP-binding protein [Oceanicella actignis]
MAEAALRVEGLSKAFGGLVASDRVSLDLRAGEIHALIGPNGAGKSTLIGQIAGWIRPDAGRVLLAGRDVTRLSPARRARLGLGRTFQVSTLALPLSARRNAMIGALARAGGAWGFVRPLMRERALTEAADAALARVGLAARADTPAAELSHGERRRLELACALAGAPRALLLDEPLAGMGPEGAAQMTELLDALRREVPILLVEHDMDAVFRLADRITVLAMGRVIAHGPPAAIRADAAVRATYLGQDDQPEAADV